ncbi:alpha-L-fucosidase [Dyadobacter sp. CY345]|uniref:alpha-L-fucosidase n=1 Tax=Dyadobacter sp. CY345 TaxID=2909335 RepID=UPI001F2D38D8|nr:alpha-L-fucosidase [Dyadobacter sp. CY345]MCF2446301.1 alpha-L-fucosidase [Dyadobacter sp. CY345]
MLNRFFTLLILLIPIAAQSQTAVKNAKPLSQLQQEFIDLRFGMFIHYNIPTYMDQDWPDPDASPAMFNPTKLDCNQWAKAAKSAGMSYGCLTTKHHSGFCIWDTKTTDYSVMNSPLKRDVVKEYAESFRANGLKVMLYYSILDTHHKLRPGHIEKKHVDMVKAQLTELLTKYGEISALIIDGWDAPWSRISYDDVPFEEIYTLVKTLQPNCLLMDLNAAKYPKEALYYTDIKSYEQGAGQHISKETNQLPALSCLPINSAWFWKKSFPNSPMKNPVDLVNNNLVPFNQAYCNFILNVAPNRDGLIDDNALKALEQMGNTWKKGNVPKLGKFDAPIISSNIAKHQPTNSSWSEDMDIMDFANDDSFTTSWKSNKEVKSTWFEIDFDQDKSFNMITIAQGGNAVIKKYRVEYFGNGSWKSIQTVENPEKIKTLRFDRVWGGKVRIMIDEFTAAPALAEVGVYNERR